MKIKIIRPDGTVIEADGTAEECAALAGVPVVAAPYYVPSVYTPWWAAPYVTPQWTYTTSDLGADLGSATTATRLGGS